MTPVSNRTVPDGCTEEWDSAIWNVGLVYRWSEVYECWLEWGRCTVKPGQTLSEAYEEWAGEPMWNEYTIFFVKETCNG